MRTLRVVAFVLAFLTFAGQLCRHVYVRWVERHESVLDRYGEDGDAEIHAAKSLDELEALYKKLAPAGERRRQMFDDEAMPGPEDRKAMSSHLRDSERLMKVEVAIRDWEEKESELRQLHYYWACGLLAIALAFLAQRAGAPWVALTLILGGLLEMDWATSPSFLGHAGEIARLLDHKMGFTVVSLILLLGLWLWGPLRREAPVGER